jgi:AbrB family looped-hinge helix DNA binding protein
MTQLVKMTRGGQITIPASIRKELDIEIGDYIEIEVVDDRLVLSPKHLIDKSQAYFWTHSWQEGEREAEEDIRSGRVEHFDSVEALFDDLDDVSE